MSRKIDFTKLEQTCEVCPSQWEYFENGLGTYIRYRGNRLRVYVNQSPVSEIFDCIEEQHLVLCINQLSSDPKDYLRGYLTSEELFYILKKHNLLEESNEDRFN
jgi:hypothetical protein